MLCQRKRVFSGGHVDLQGTTEVGKGVHRTVQAGILSLLRTAGPHPVGRKRKTVHAIGQRSPHDVGKCLCHREHTSGLWIGQSSLRGMSQSGGDTLASTVVECHHTAVAQGQLQGTLALLACYLARHRAIDLVGKPVLAGYSLDAQYILYTLDELIFAQ